MRPLKTLSLLLFFLSSLAATASAQQVGERIVVTADKALLRSQETTTGTVPKGNILVVQNVNGDWFWVTSSGLHETVKGWINRSDVTPFPQAFDFFNDELKRNPASAAYVIRGGIWLEKGENDSAITDFNDAIRLDPKNARAYLGRGMAWDNKSEYPKAVTDYDEALRLDPKFTAAYFNRGISWKSQAKYDKALADYSAAIKLDPKYATAWNSRAWLTATCPNAKYRDGKQAVVDATKGCGLTGWKNGESLDSLAAAYAETGDFANAVKWQEKAVELAPAMLTGELQSRLELYKAHKPYRDEPKT
jgi:tetratricopeptide (TPR) repeat protein